ncbi:MAG: hypothetical protein WB676_32695 [Bryobacteraceae bacterium]
MRRPIEPGAAMCAGNVVSTAPAGQSQENRVACGGAPGYLGTTVSQAMI